MHVFHLTLFFRSQLQLNDDRIHDVKCGFHEFELPSHFYFTARPFIKFNFVPRSKFFNKLITLAASTVSTLHQLMVNSSSVAPYSSLNFDKRMNFL